MTEIKPERAEAYSTELLRLRKENAELHNKLAELWPLVEARFPDTEAESNGPPNQ